jgi:hypothetical protein
MCPIGELVFRTGERKSCTLERSSIFEIMQHGGFMSTDDRRIVRFLNQKYASAWVGKLYPAGVNFRLDYYFRFGLLSQYQESKAIEGDSEEARITIAGKGTSHLANDALVSCWSVWPEDAAGNNPWEYFDCATFKDKGVAIVSTVSQVLKIVEDLKTFLVAIYDSKQKINFISCHGDVIYYDPTAGTQNIPPMFPKNIRYHMLNKRSYRLMGNDKHDYSKENEYRFALIISPVRFLTESTDFFIDANKIIRPDYTISREKPKNSHYIDGIYYNNPVDNHISELIQQAQILKIPIINANQILSHQNLQELKMHQSSDNEFPTDSIEKLRKAQELCGQSGEQKI